MIWYIAKVCMLMKTSVFIMTDEITGDKGLVWNKIITMKLKIDRYSELYFKKFMLWNTKLGYHILWLQGHLWSEFTFKQLFIFFSNLIFFKIMFIVNEIYLSETGPMQWLFGQQCDYW